VHDTAATGARLDSVVVVVVVVVVAGLY